MRHFYSQYSSLILKALFCCTDWQPILLQFHSLTKYLSQLSLQFPNIYRNIIGKEFHMGSFSGLSDSCLSKCTIQLFINNSERHQHSTFFLLPSDVTIGHPASLMLGGDFGVLHFSGYQNELYLLFTI